MNRNRFNRLLKLFFLGVFLFILSSCATTTNYEISKNYSKEKYKRIALLVVRVGNLTHNGCPVPIILDTDYSIRTPQVGSTFLQYPAKVDVYIEDEDRLRESLPAYPNYTLHGLTVKVKYFKNITPQIYKTVSGLLAEKGYHVVDVKEVAASWPKKISEMKISEIVEALKKDVDAVLVMHYADIGYYYVWSRDRAPLIDYYAWKCAKLELTGFVKLEYVVSMFDAYTKEKVVHYKSNNPLMATAMAEDPEIKNNPELAKKIKTEASCDRVNHSFTDDEVINFAMRYLSKGIHVKDRVSWKGLEEVMP